MPNFESSDLLLMRRNRWILVFSLSPMLGALGLIVAARPLYAPHLVLLSAALAVFTYRRNWRPSFEPLMVRASATGVELGARLIPRRWIRAGLVRPGIAPRVVFRRRFLPNVELQASSNAQARALLRALGLDASQAEASFVALSKGFAHPGYAPGAALALVVIVLASTVAGDHVRAVTMWLWVPTILLFVVPSQLRVGVDGILLRWLWVSRRIHLNDIENVTRYEERWGQIVGLRFELLSSEMRVPMGLRLRTSLETWGEAEMALAWERIREVIESGSPGSGQGPSSVPAKE